MTPTTPQSVLECFSRLTGTPMRIASTDQRAQSIAFCEAGFELADLEAVINFTKKEMKKDRATLNKFSLQWSVLFGRYGGGAEFQVFQERLGIAMRERAARKPRVENLIPITRIMDESGSTITTLQCSPIPDATPVDKSLLDEQMAELKRWAGGASA